MSPTRDSSEAKTRELERPEPRALPAAWCEDADAGVYAHASGVASIEKFGGFADAALAEAETIARDVVDLLVWARRERAISRLAPAEPPTGPTPPEAA